MDALLLDAGNTSIRARAWSLDCSTPADVVGKKPIRPLVTVGEFSTSDSKDDPAEMLRELGALRKKVEHPPVVLVSVVPAVTRQLGNLWPDLTVVDHRAALPFTSRVEDLASVGPDRLCNVAAACAAGMTDALIVDAGTATTFDILDNGIFAGGLIAPGMAFAAEQLGQFAARLDPIPFGPCPLAPGEDTDSAMAAGAWHVGTGGVEAVISGLLKERGGIPVILTGGLGNHLAGPGRFVDLDWTMRGAVVLAGLIEF